MIRLNHTHSFLKLQAKFLNLRFVFWQNFQRIKHNSLHLPKNPTNNATFALFIHPIYLFSDACPGRELSEIPANRAEFT